MKYSFFVTSTHTYKVQTTWITVFWRFFSVTSITTSVILFTLNPLETLRCVTWRYPCQSCTLEDLIRPFIKKMVCWVLSVGMEENECNPLLKLLFIMVSPTNIFTYIATKFRITTYTQWHYMGNMLCKLKNGEIKNIKINVEGWIFGQLQMRVYHINRYWRQNLRHCCDTT